MPRFTPRLPAHAPVFYFVLTLVLTFGWVVGTGIDRPIVAQTTTPTPDVSAEKALSPAACPSVNYPAPTVPSVFDEASNLGSDYSALYTSPPNSAGPTRVDTGLYVVSITNVDEIQNTFQVETFLDLVWCDPRLAYDPESLEPGTDEKIFLEADAAAFIEEVWWPDISLVNIAAPVEPQNQLMRIKPHGTAKYEQFLSLTLQAEFNLAQFPFDRQILPIQIESFAWNSNFLVFQEQDDTIGFSEDFSLPEWELETVETAITTRKEIRDRAPFSKFEINLGITRFWGYYVYKVLIPLMLLVTASWSIFWMGQDALADRLGVSLTGTLSVVAYQFLIVQDLPKISLITQMDAIILLSFTFTILTVFENVIVAAVHAENPHQARRLDLLCRWTFPVVYAAMLGTIGLVYRLG
ncbi:MAG: hypothetical protein VKJ85_14395 [Prochlorothrix sp.]|nr:hypothetical protein [Prochlorothrix sp.]